MSILDDAIREHLELKRAHGADEEELRRLQDEAFGPPQRPDEIDPFAEAPTEFLPAPPESPAEEPEIADEHLRSGRRPDVADLQEAPPAAEPAQSPPAAKESEPQPGAEESELPPSAAASQPPAAAEPPEASPAAEPRPADSSQLPPPKVSDAADAPPPPPAGAPAAGLAPPGDEAPPPPPPPDEAPALPTDEPEAAAGPSPAERRAIAEQPTQMFDVQAHVEAEAEAAATSGEGSSPPAGSPERPPLENRGPDAEVAGHPPPEAEPEEGSAEFDFFNEQRLSEELDQALEAPLPPTDEHLAMPRQEDAPAEQGRIFDFESQPQGEQPYQDDPSQEVLRRAEEAEAAEEPAEEEPESHDDPETDYDPETGHEDVLEDTPRFLEDAPEDDDLWFEQKPPKDFDLD